MVVVQSIYLYLYLCIFSFHLLKADSLLCFTINFVSFAHLWRGSSMDGEQLQKALLMETVVWGALRGRRRV